MNHWVTTKLGTVLGPKGYIRGPFGSSLLRNELQTQGIPVYEQQHAIYNHRNFRFYIDSKKHKELERFTVKENDLIISCSGTLGKVSIIKKDDPKGIISQALLILRPDISKIDIKYLYFFLLSPAGINSIVSVSSGSVQTNIAKRSIIEGTDIFLPPLPEQRAIAGTLSSLDDKIDLLHRQNKTLEGMAEAFWRKMFLEDADPNWKKGKLGDYGVFKNGINYSRNENGDTEYSILNVRDIVESKYVNMGNFEKVSINNSKATPYLLEKGDIVIVRSASPGESLIVLEEIAKLIYSGFSIRLRCYDKKHSLFLFQFLQSYKKEMDTFSDGTTLKNINQEILNSIELVIPEKDAVNKFNDSVAEIYNKILLNQSQIRTLSHLRDTLLPKLMSGEVRVKM